MCQTEINVFSFFLFPRKVIFTYLAGLLSLHRKSTCKEKMYPFSFLLEGNLLIKLFQF